MSKFRNISIEEVEYEWIVFKRVIREGMYRLEEIGTVITEGKRERDAIVAAREKYNKTGLRVRLNRTRKTTYTVTNEQLKNFILEHGKKEIVYDI